MAMTTARHLRQFIWRHGEANGNEERRAVPIRGRHRGALPPQLEYDMSNLFKSFASNESGAAAVEYGLLAALIAVVIISSVTAVGTKLSSTFADVSTALTSANN